MSQSGLGFLPVIKQQKLVQKFCIDFYNLQDTGNPVKEVGSKNTKYSGRNRYGTKNISFAFTSVHQRSGRKFNEKQN
jgi:hypothetical protein